MTKIGPIDFDDCILDALRDDNLVVFAGAGVSAGSPSNLASFKKLANDIAMGTGQVAVEPLDRFLGELHHRNVAVHQRAAQLLSPTGSAPNDLHHNLLRLFRAGERVRLVTTNFDQHFEIAAKTLFENLPDVYRAPALPLGCEFNGIVHVHGSLVRSSEMVLTDADFGRAYLTEGWARRFLVDVFRRYTVLFVGYSHNDVVMNYLARALPADRVAGRFVLTDEEGSWELLGIKPIRFNKGTGDDAYKELYDGVQQLTDRVIRGVLDWQTRLAEIGGRVPPADEEAIGEVEQALREVHTTRFLTNVARDAEWPRWLNAHKHLDALFGIGKLSERDNLLAGWLAQNFTIEHPEAMFGLIAAHGLRLNPVFWWNISRELGATTEKILEESTFKRWITILLACAPYQPDHHVLMWLAERCAAFGFVHLTLKVFLFMSGHDLTVKPGFWHDQEDAEHGRRLVADCPLRADHWSLNEVWAKHLKPHIALVVQSLLSGSINRFEEIHYDLMAWDKGSREWDPNTYNRSAIEPHEQDCYPKAIDVLIDVARDSLEWLAVDSPALLDAWIERLVISDVSILRRLAVHAITVHTEKTADERLNWLMERLGLHSIAEHHEVYRSMALNYPSASATARQAVVDMVCAHKLPASDYYPADIRTARSHFDWLSWLIQARPDCPLAEAALAPIKAEYPDWGPSDHLDLLHWSGSAEWTGSQSPWTVDQLLAREPGEQLDDFLTFKGKGNSLHEPDRVGLIAAIKEACKFQPFWAFALAKELAAKFLWTSDLWPAVIRGWQESELTDDDWRAVLAMTANQKLHVEHLYDVANLLFALVRDGGKPFALDLLVQANNVALPVWLAIEAKEEDEDMDDWLSCAINRPAGVIVEFWINGLSLLMHGKSGPERTLPDNYRKWFTDVIQDPTSNGGLGRSVLASQTAFLFGLSEVWTRENIVPLFSDADSQKFRQAWDGFLTWGRLYPALVDALLPAFIAALARLDVDFPARRRNRFVEFYAMLAVFHVSDPMKQLLPEFFQHGSLEDRINFTSQLGYFLRQMNAATKQQLWDSWLYRYWQARQQAVPSALDVGEIRNMLDWLPLLDELFPVAVLLAVHFPPIRIEHSHMLFELRKSDIVTRYPTETAELLIYLCKCQVVYHPSDLATVAARLPDLEPELKCRLDEGLALAGAS
ncbi:MAG: DUF4020 domain-containing protein [Deltaproteobacteria bacterium]|jgi:hypothetical protein|uniref:DUF4020 domain-containing protein n=1 Tax=Hydrosulfovibrio ferrireducens TaxID=2934181 RepID=UPI0012297A0D|nr:MAG: DUF4020 domain-containing protein [Deltaproteobacteria bacterium]